MCFVAGKSQLLQELEGTAPSCGFKAVAFGQVLGEKEAWDVSMQKARQSVTELEQLSDELDAPLKKRLAAIAAFVSECT